MGGDARDDRAPPDDRARAARSSMRGVLEDMGFAIAHPDQAGAMKFAADAAWKSAGVLVADAARHDGDRRGRRARPGRAEADGQEAEARLRPAQRAQGHQAHVRRRRCGGSSRSRSRRSSVLIAIAWPTVAHAVGTLHADLERIAREPRRDRRGRPRSRCCATSRSPVSRSAASTTSCSGAGS